MIVGLMGKKKVDFTNDKGEKIEGINMYYVGRSENVYGLACKKQFISSKHSLYKKVNEKEITHPLKADFIYEIDAMANKLILVDINFAEKLPALGI